MTDAGAFTTLLGQMLNSAQENLNSLKKKNTVLSLTSIFGSSFATLVTGWTAASGPIVMSDSVSGWRLMCAIGAVFALAASISGGMAKQFRLEERLSLTRQCVGKLRALEVSRATGRRSLDALAAEFEEIQRDYSEVL